MKSKYPNINKTFILEPFSGATPESNYTTGTTIIDNIVYYNRTDKLSAYTLNLSALTWSNENIPPNSVGGYSNDEPATPPEGLTFSEAMNKLLFPILSPIISTFTATPQPEYLEPNFTIDINWEIDIQTAGASLDSLNLEYRRNSSGNWSGLTPTITTGGTFNHNISGNTTNETFNYRLTATDSSGGESATTINRTMTSYVNPTLNPSSILSQTREIGDINYSTNRDIVKQSQYVPLTSWIPTIQLNNGSIDEFSGSTAIIGDPTTENIDVNINENSITNILNATSIKSWVKITDEETITNRQILNLTLRYKQFYGTTNTVPTTSSDIRGLPNNNYDNTNTLTWFANGTVHVIAIPSSKSIVEVTTSNNETITDNFTNGLTSISVEDAGGTLRTYNVYIYETVLDFDVTITAIIS